MNSSPRILCPREQGFSLVELIMVIVILGIIASVISVFIARPISGYVDSVRRAELTDAADTASRRIARDVRTALPNSLRQNGGNTQCIEMLPIVGGGRYRAELSGNDATESKFDFLNSGAFSFNVLADSGVGTLPAGTNSVVVYNIGIPGADAYAGSNRRAISSVTNGAAPNMKINLAAGTAFTIESPGHRFHVVPATSVMYSCTGGTIIRSTPSVAAAPASCPAASGTVVVDNVDCASSSFVFTPNAMRRNGLLGITLRITRNSESVQLYSQIHVNNVP